MESKFRNTETLINDIASPMATSNGVGYERAKAELAAKLANDVSEIFEKLNTSILASSESSDKLGKKIFWLNIVLALATSVGAIATVAIAING